MLRQPRRIIGRRQFTALLLRLTSSELLAGALNAGAGSGKPAKAAKPAPLIRGNRRAIQQAVDPYSLENNTETIPYDALAKGVISSNPSSP